MVDSNVNLAVSTDGSVTSSDTITDAEARSNIAYLRTQAESWLVVLFNIFGSVTRDGQAMVGDVIKSWASIAGEDVRGLVLPSEHILMRICRILPRHTAMY